VVCFSWLFQGVVMLCFYSGNRSLMFVSVFFVCGFGFVVLSYSKIIPTARHRLVSTLASGGILYLVFTISNIISKTLVGLYQVGFGVFWGCRTHLKIIWRWF